MTTIQALVLLALGAAYLLLPGMRRNGLFFSVTVPDDYPSSDAAKRIHSRYQFAVCAHTVMAVALLLFCEHGHLRPHDAILVAFAWQSLWVIVAYAAARKAVLPQSIDTWSVREASLAPRPAEPASGLWLQFVALIPLIAAGIVLALEWSSLPVRYPAHWNLSGHADRWVAKSAGSVFAPLVVGLALCSVFAFLNWSVKNRTRGSVQGGAQMRAVLMLRRFVLGVVTATQCFIATLFSILALLPLVAHDAQVAVLHGLLAGTGLFVAALVFWSVTMLKTRKAAGVAAGDMTPDRCWKAGIFYWNPDDPALFVEKRLGIGYTFNFARPTAWIFLLLVIALPLIIARLSNS